ncbi:p115 like vesicle tethering protein [Polychytrium aggregatum]|uniref:p115 like vesicle tethering protein n=1 Tax=Polychytrium aggregatum TaxID=110093 RepID=UPI0022FF372C|nr:p115 like vesicle tethering protein [Polychytrium aggregatum]KAI9206543.1 p115 like vesicle tethering protein [Polychytrium aggregatum]
MDLFSSFHSVLRGDRGAPQTGAETVEKLCDRVVNSTLLEDRRAAVTALKSCARDWKLDVGTKGMGALVNVLKTDRMDVAIIKVTIETLDLLCSKDLPQKGAKVSDDLGLMFTEIFIKDPKNVTIILDILEEYDFYVRLYAIQFLATLLANMPNQLQDCILASPVGVSRLMDLLDDRREVIRNDGLLLLISLTQSNAEIQKIVAFENAFDRLLVIIIEEDGIDGGIIVQDCLQLTLNLLRYNVSNQNFFRESSCIQKIQYLINALDAKKGHEAAVPSKPWSDQKIANTALVMDLIRILVVPNSPNTAINQNVMGQAHIIHTLIDVALNNAVPAKVQIQALRAMADSIRGNPSNQDVLSKSFVVADMSEDNKQKDASPMSALFALITIATCTAESFVIRAAAAYALECYLHENHDAQVTLVSALKTSTVAQNGQQLGSHLMSSFLEFDRKDVYKSWFAGTIIIHMLEGNVEARKEALNLQPRSLDDDDSSLLHKSMFALLSAHREGVDIRVKLGYLCLIAVWLCECPAAVQNFLTEGANLQFLIEQVSQSSGVDPVVQGLAAYILGLCYEYNDDSDANMTRSSLQSLVVNRIGVDIYMSRLERLRSSNAFTAGLTNLGSISDDVEVDENGLPAVYFDSSFIQLLKATLDDISKSITNPKSKKPQRKLQPVLDDTAEKSVIQSYKDIIANQDQEIGSLKQKIRELEDRLQLALQSHANQVDSLNGSITKLQSNIDANSAKFVELEKEQEDLLVCLADQDIVLKRYRQKLRQYGEVIESDDDADA